MTERLHFTSVFWQFMEFSLLWSFLTVGGVVRVACQGFLFREACVSVLAWRIPGMGEPGGLPSLGSHRVGHD